MTRARWGGHGTVARPGVPSPFAVALLARFVHPLMRIHHRASLENADRLDRPGPFLLVANHPPSLGTAEFTAFMALYARRFGATRPLAGFAHAASFGWWPLSWVFGHIGAIPSTYDAAHRALDTGVPVVLFPGGDHEGFRPFWKANEVDFGGRLGFLRIARQAWVPVVPMGIRGVTAPLLFGSRLLPYLFVWPRLAGVKRYGLSLAALIGASAILSFAPTGLAWRILLAWLWAASPLALVSWIPARITVRVGAPIPPEELFGERGSKDDASLTAALARVETAVEQLVR